MDMGMDMGQDMGMDMGMGWVWNLRSSRLLFFVLEGFPVFRRLGAGLAGFDFFQNGVDLLRKIVDFRLHSCGPRGYQFDLIDTYIDVCAVGECGCCYI